MNTPELEAVAIEQARNWNTATPDELRRIADVIESRECTGVTATWCPIHGDCTCPPDPDERYLNDDGCPLHDSASSHAEAENA